MTKTVIVTLLTTFGNRQGQQDRVSNTDSNNRNSVSGNKRLATECSFEGQFSQRRVRRRMEKQMETEATEGRQGTPMATGNRDPQATAQKWRSLHERNKKRQQAGNKEPAIGNIKKWLLKLESSSFG